MTAASPSVPPTTRGSRLLRRALGALPSALPRRQEALRGQHALVDGIPYTMPVNSDRSPVVMAAFPMDYDDAASLLPGRELHPMRITSGRSLFVVTVINYLSTDIGRYIEYSLAVAVTHGRRPAPPLVPGLFQKRFGVGQFVVDLPVSTEVSVKGGKGIWGMPKHQASLDFQVSETTVSSRYEKDGVLGCQLDVQRPASTGVPLKLAAANYCAFRGMLMKSSIYVDSVADVALGGRARATLTLGDAPGVRPLTGLDISPEPIFTAFMPEARGVLDDHFECWFLTSDTADAAAAAATGDPWESIVALGRSEEWLPPPQRATPQFTSGVQAASARP